MKVSKLVFAVCALSFIIVTGCNSSKKEPQAPASQAPAGISLSGKVAETMNSGGYTYVFIENNGQKTWVAIPETKVKVGQQVSCQPGMEMKNFTSKTMNRTFESIIFSSGLM